MSNFGFSDDSLGLDDLQQPSDPEEITAPYAAEDPDPAESDYWTDEGGDEGDHLFAPGPEQTASGDPEASLTMADDLSGDPEEGSEHWRPQEQHDTCAIATEASLLEALTGEVLSESQLVSEATENGWYLPGAGTPRDDAGKLLEAHGLEVERYSGADIHDLEAVLDGGGGAIVAVDADEIWASNQGWQDELRGALPSAPGLGGVHAVTVIGIDRSNPDEPLVILNDPGRSDGRGLEVPSEDFVNAWNDSNNFLVAVEVHLDPAEVTGHLIPESSFGQGERKERASR